MGRRAALALLLVCSSSQATNWHVPHPWRTEAVVEGRRADYGDERFLHEFSYRHLIDTPGPVENGIRGSGGSVDSDTLFYDFRFLNAYVFDNPKQAFTLDVQRGEDFDGGYDRQLVGFRQTLGEDWQLSIRGDVFADKSGSDIYFGARRLIGDGWLDVQYVLPDAYFNEKTSSDSIFRTAPQTLFLQYYRKQSDGHTLVSVNLTPEATLNDREARLVVDARQQRLALEHWQMWGDLQWRLSLKGETSRRETDLDENPQIQSFRRDAGSATLSLHWPKARYSPNVGVHYFKLEEEGWFGRTQNDRGEVVREEPLLFTGMTWTINDRQRIEPTVYISRPRIDQTATGDWKQREEDTWIGKLAIPWHWVVSEEHGAIMTLTPSFRLHRAAFGGGNLQFHWPL